MNPPSASTRSPAAPSSIRSKALNRQGMTVLYTTHYMEEAEELSNRVGIIDHGELIALGTQAELTRQVGQTDTLILHVGEAERNRRWLMP